MLAGQAHRDVPAHDIVDVVGEHARYELRRARRPLRSQIGHPAAQGAIEMARQRAEKLFEKAAHVAVHPIAGQVFLPGKGKDHGGAGTGARLALNEISPLRRECLGILFPDAIVTGYDGELIDEMLSPNVAPSVALMNPPYSHGIERGHDGRTGARHLRSAWKRLLPGGRLVAVMPEWFDLPRFLVGITGPVALRLNAAIERGFVKQGTSITTRLLVLDKVDGGDSPVIGKPVNFAELCFLVGLLPNRTGHVAEPRCRRAVVRW